MCFWMRNYLKFRQIFVIVGKLGTTSPPNRWVKSQVWLYLALGMRLVPSREF